jgi:hypothetical protein
MLLSCLALFLVSGSSAPVPLPEFYKSLDRLVWVVRNVEHSEKAWSQIGLTDIRPADGDATGTYRNKPVTFSTKRILANLGDLGVDMVQPAAGDTALSAFSKKHGEGIFSRVYDVPTQEGVRRETRRLADAGVDVLETMTLWGPGGPVTYTFFDTEPKGKYVLGLAYWENGAPAKGTAHTISHIAPAAYAKSPASEFWERLGFPGLTIEHATPRDDSRYRGKPLSLYFDVGWQHFSQMTLEWIIPPADAPPNIYADFLKQHGEGIQHLGMPVDDLPKAAARFEALGYHVRQAGAWGDVGQKDSGQYDYMDTDGIGGVDVELIHAYH